MFKTKHIRIHDRRMKKKQKMKKMAKKVRKIKERDLYVPDNVMILEALRSKTK